MPGRLTDGLAASAKTPTAKAMKSALTVYSNAIGVPDASASQPARGIPAIPMSPLAVASARRAKRSSESVDSLNRGVLMAVISILSSWVYSSTGAGVDAATSVSGESGPGGRESRQTAHAEVLGVSEG